MNGYQWLLSINSFSDKNPGNVNGYPRIPEFPGAQKFLAARNYPFEKRRIKKFPIRNIGDACNKLKLKQKDTELSEKRQKDRSM
jgi:hypothetical protein